MIIVKQGFLVIDGLGFRVYRVYSLGTTSSLGNTRYSQPSWGL